MDGNGTLHHRGAVTPKSLIDSCDIFFPTGFGLASHLGVKSGIPCVGVGKTLLCVDGLQKNKQKVNTTIIVAFTYTFNTMYKCLFALAGYNGG